MKNIPLPFVKNYKQIGLVSMVTVVIGFHGFTALVTMATFGECCITCAGAVTGLESGTLKTTCILHKVVH